jgi:hypothetical protein
MSAASKLGNRDYPTSDAMPSGRSVASPKPPIFQIHRPDTTLFTTLDGLTKQTGERAGRLRRLMCKELVDNALDAADAAGRPGQVTIEKHGTSTYVVTDRGDGIDSDDLAGLFTVHRAMISTKYLRKPERGALGNGLRVVVGCVVAAGGTIEVITRGTRTVLRPRRVGPTEIVEVTSAPDEIGTTLIVHLGDALPDDGADRWWARAAIDFAKHTKAPAFTRQPSPHWLDLDVFIEALMLIEPDTVTVRQIVELFDGCSGAKAGRLAAPFGKNRLARSMSDDEAAALLRSMQAAARVVKPGAFGLIGADAFDPDDYSYASANGTFDYGAHHPQAEIIHTVEAWVCATTRKGKSAEIEVVFANRTPIVGGEVTAERDTYDPKQLEFFGCGLDCEAIGDLPLGDFRASLHIISPFIPLLSIGKRPNLEPFMPAIAEALRRAFKRSRDQLPLDMPEPKERPPLKPPRPPKIEPPPKPPREVYQPQGVLGQLIAAEAEAVGLTVADLRVMSAKRDPYTLDTVDNHRIGQWFADQINRFVAAHVTVHLRGLHYLLCSTAIVRPDNTPYVNNHTCWNWLQDDASKAARWLGYVDFDRIHDARNEDPIWCARSRSAYEISTSSSGERKVGVYTGSLDAEVPDLGDMLPSLTISGSKRPEQPFRLGLIGEKSSLRPVVELIAHEYAIDVVLDTGDASDSHLYQMAKRAAADHRPFVVFYLSDFDPGGHNMPTSVSRKFQAMCDLQFCDLDLRLYPVALTSEQCITYALPSAPLQQSESRKEKWLARFGREQTELDALMVLWPGELERLLHAAIEPFFDRTLNDRFAAADAMPADVPAWFKALPAYTAAVDAITPLREAAIEAAEALNDAAEQHIDSVRKAVREAEDAPKLDPVEVEPEITVEPPEPLFHSRDGFLTATRKLIARRDGDSDSDDAEGGAA